jgi:hypothetical protein
MAAINGALHARSPCEAELEANLSIVPTYGRYALASRALTEVNERTADSWFYPRSFSTGSSEHAQT